MGALYIHLLSTITYATISRWSSTNCLDEPERMLAEIILEAKKDAYAESFARGYGVIHDAHPPAYTKSDDYIFSKCGYGPGSSAMTPRMLGTFIKLKKITDSDSDQPAWGKDSRGDCPPVQQGKTD